MPEEALHRRSISSLNDLEKSIDSSICIDDIEEEFEADDTKHRYDIVYVIIALLITGVFINIIMIGSTERQVNLNLFGHKEAEINKLLNVDNINLKDVERNEWTKLNHPSPVPKPSEVVTNTKDIGTEFDEFDEFDEYILFASDKNTQRDITEILSINSIVILTNEMNLIQEQKVRDIFTNLKITPEIKFVELNKHPNYTKILKYLKDYNIRAYQYDKEYTQHSYHIDNLDIPRLFIGGLPVANYEDIIKKQRNDELNEFLRNYGQGLIRLDV